MDMFLMQFCLQQHGIFCKQFLALIRKIQYLKMVFDFEDGLPIRIQTEQEILALQSTNLMFLLQLQREITACVDLAPWVRFNSSLF